MYFGLSEEQNQFQDYVKKFLSDNVSVDDPKIANGDDQKLHDDIKSGLMNLGLSGLLIPENYGGLGGDLLSAVSIAQGLGTGVGPISFAGSYVMAPIALSLGGNDDQKDKYLPKIASNEIKFGVGLSEYVAAREDSGIELNKGKASGSPWIDGDDADFFILSDKGGTMFIVDKNDKGLEIIQLTTVDKTRLYLELNLKTLKLKCCKKQKIILLLSRRL